MNDAELEALAKQSEGDFRRRIRTMTDFRYDEIQEKYWDTTTGNLLGPRSVDGAIPVDEWPTKLDPKTDEPKPYSPAKAINNIDTGLTVEGSTWWPGQDQFILNTVVTERGARAMNGAVCYNAYIPPDPPVESTTVDPEPWYEHVRLLYPDPVEHNHFFDFCAHMIQRPDQKVNHGIVLTGAQGIGKDTALYPVRKGVGEWNAAEVGPDAITSQYNGFMKSVLLVINEVRPHDEDFKASNFYNLLKPMLASPPEMLAMTLKYANTIYIRNLCHVILTTNDPLAMYIPKEDRRLFIMSSPMAEPAENPQLSPEYFQGMYAFFESGGADSTIKSLCQRNITDFHPQNTPPMTTGKKRIIESADQIRRNLLDDILERMAAEKFGGKLPKILFQKDLIDFIRNSNYFDDAQKAINAINAKNFHFKMSDRGFHMIRNPNAQEWRNGKYRTRIAFFDKTVPQGDALAMVEEALESRPLVW